MPINIEYFSQFSKNNTNLIIVLSKLNELNTINIPFDPSNILNNKNIVNKTKGIPTKALIILKYITNS